MITVHKYPMPFPCDDCTIYLPEGAEVLTVGVQHGGVYLWAKVDDEKPTSVQHWFRFADTGHNLTGEDIKSYINTLMMQGGALVFHVFEIEL